MVAALWPILPNHTESNEPQQSNKTQQRKKEHTNQPHTAGEKAGQQKEHPQQHPPAVALAMRLKQAGRASSWDLGPEFLGAELVRWF